MNLTDENKSIAFMSEEEKAQLIRYDESGKRLVYIGNNNWVQEENIKTPLEMEKYNARYSIPKIYIYNVISNIVLPLLAIITTVFLLYAFNEYKGISFSFKEYFCISIILIIIYILLRLKDIAIFTIKIYQLKAPMKIRKRCKMTPTCSDYMILSIQKYGLLFGAIKGWKRLKRCNDKEIEDWP